MLRTLFTAYEWNGMAWHGSECLYCHRWCSEIWFFNEPLNEEDFSTKKKKDNKSYEKIFTEISYKMLHRFWRICTRKKIENVKPCILYGSHLLLH